MDELPPALPEAAAPQPTRVEWFELIGKKRRTQTHLSSALRPICPAQTGSRRVALSTYHVNVVVAAAVMGSVDVAPTVNDLDVGNSLRSTPWRTKRVGGRSSWRRGSSPVWCSEFCLDEWSGTKPPRLRPLLFG
jgi:hypothetical protein